MVEMTRVWERLYIGGRDDAERLYKENPSGITTVLSLCEERVLRRNPTINYVHISIADAKPVAVGQFDAIIDALAGNIRWGTVLLHCHAGVSRAPIMAASWLHVVGCKNIEAALMDIKPLRPVVSPSSILLASVKEHLR